LTKHYRIKLTKQKIDEGDPDSMYAYYCLHKFHWTPSFFMSLDKNERAFVIASINARVEQEEEESKKVGKVR